MQFGQFDPSTRYMAGGRLEVAEPLHPHKQNDLAPRAATR